MSRQAEPSGEQRCHCGARTAAPSLQTPLSAVSVSPSAALPATVGGTTAAGATKIWAGEGGATTTGVGVEAEVAEPSPLVAVTATTSVEPRSSAETTYAEVSAPAMSAQAAAASQRCHWYA